MDQGLAEHNKNLELQKDLEGVLKHAAPHLSRDELALLQWACGVRIPEPNRVNRRVG